MKKTEKYKKGKEKYKKKKENSVKFSKWNIFLIMVAVVVILFLLVNLAYRTFNVTDRVNKKTNLEKEIMEFNSEYEKYNGSNTGFYIQAIIDKMIENNKKYERNIVVRLDGVTYSTEPEMLTARNSIGRYTNYRVKYEYDKDGFIHILDLATIKVEENN